MINTNYTYLKGFSVVVEIKNGIFYEKMGRLTMLICALVCVYKFNSGPTIRFFPDRRDVLYIAYEFEHCVEFATKRLKLTKTGVT